MNDVETIFNTIVKIVRKKGVCTPIQDAVPQNCNTCYSWKLGSIVVETLDHGHTLKIKNYNNSVCDISAIKEYGQAISITAGSEQKLKDLLTTIET
jgi:hypothetical protein